MKINEIRSPVGAVKNKKRLGRGESSGTGKTAGKGNKGQRARAGGYHKVGFEGGQMPLQRRLPKRGFIPLNRREFAIVNIEDLSRFPANTQIDFGFLKDQGIVKKALDGLKILGDGDINIPLIVKAASFSEKAKEKLIKAGGQAIVETR